MNNSILQISSDKKNCLGTGFVIDKDKNGVFVATCGHVINSCQENILVEGHSSEIIENKYKDGLDLAILYVKGLFHEPLSISEKLTTSNVKVIGYSKLLGHNKKEPINDIEIKLDIELTTPQRIKAIKLYPREAIADGYSGSPVICQSTNEVIGIVNIKVGDDTNYAISAQHLSDIYDIKNPTYKKIVFNSSTKKGLTTKIDKENHTILKVQFEKKLEESLQAFSTQPKVWIEPRLHTKEEDSSLLSDEDTKVNIEDILKGPKSLLIQARQQFGLTCLAHYLVKEVWTDTKPSYWLYLDANELKPHTKEIDKHVSAKLKEINLSMEDIECVILDEFSSSIKHASKILNKTSDFFKEKPLIVMMTLIENPLLNEEISPPENREFERLYLWALPRNDIRKVVCTYNDERYIGDENKIVDKIVSDLEVLNIPRTPLNCLTILKISEIEFDDSPVNRTEMIKRVLFLLFNIDEIPEYKTKPDLKDTEYALGYFCELMLREQQYYFSREHFLDRLNSFCEASEIDLDVHIIFDVLYSNHIIIMRDQQFCFKFNYWIFYFAAHRMYHNLDFSDYILKDMNYTAYPELIEFYTGIDRRRDDALQILTKDIRSTCDIVEEKCGLPSKFNIYNIAQWKPSEEKIEQMHNEVSDGVLNSNLPEAIKDQYADQSYNRARPLMQSIHKILEEYSLLRLMKSVTAGAKALRNSDYSKPEIRHELLDEILRSWEQITKVLLVMTPILSEKGVATLEGASFVLNGSFGESSEEKFNKIIQVIPTNIVAWYKDDLFSKKMGTLFYKHIKSEENELTKHFLNLLIINKRPKEWDTHIKEYIESENKNSFYLFDVYHTLRAEYQYSFASDSELRTLEKLIKITATKHHLGIKKPSQKIINKLEKEDKYKDIIPERDKDLE